MSRALLVIINGPPGAGKSVLGGRLAHELGFPFISKDNIKEILFDILGWHDREWSKNLGHASMELLFHFAECELRVGKSVVLETALNPEFHTARFLNLASQYDCALFQIYCWAREDVLLERFRKRLESGERHPGHVGHLMTCDQFRDILRRGTNDVLQIGGSLLEVETSDFEKIDYEALVAAILSARDQGR